MKMDLIKEGAFPETPELEEIRGEKEILAQQVKRLIRAEGKLYAYQEQLDAQLREYKELYELNRKLNTTFELGEIFACTIEYIIRNLEYERVLLLEEAEGSGGFAVTALDGYYDEDERRRAESLVIGGDDPFLTPLYRGVEYMICDERAETADLLEYRDRFLMNEYLVYPLSVHGRPMALLAVGNSAENAAFYRRVSDAEGALLGMGNLVGLLSSSMENHLSHAGMIKALEQERVAEAKYRGIFENALEGILQTTAGGRFISCNPATAAILGYDSPAELMEKVDSIARLYVSPRRRTELYALMLEKGEVKNFEVEFFRKDGSKQWVLISTRPVFGGDREILYVDGMLQDISERKNAEMALQRLNDELEQRVADRTGALETANAELLQVTRELETACGDLKAAQSQVLQQEKMASIGQLAAGVAHEINNPMGFIISNLNSLKKYADKVNIYINAQSAALDRLIAATAARAVGDDLAALKKSLKMDYILGDLGSLIDESLDGAERVKKIVQELKSFSRVDESETKAADINGGLESTINIVWNELKYKATVVREYGEIPLTTCNPGQLNQVFMNILVNAAQAIETQGEIAVRTWSDSGFIGVAISDTGKGIAPDKLGRIFEPFFTTKEVGKGTGLGLSIAYDIIKKHNGEIRVESELNRGTTFTILLPVKEG